MVHNYGTYMQQFGNLFFFNLFFLITVQREMTLPLNKR